MCLFKRLRETGIAERGCRKREFLSHSSFNIPWKGEGILFLTSLIFLPSKMLMKPLSVGILAFHLANVSTQEKEGKR